MSSQSRTSEAWEAMFRPAKPKAQAEFICPHCNKTSGWTKPEIIAIHGDHDLKCQNKECGKIAMQVRSGSFSKDAINKERRGGNEGKKPKFTPYRKRGQNAVR